MTDEKLPRDVPLDPMAPGAYYQDYIRVVVAAEVLGVAGSTIRRYIADGKLPAMKIGKIWYVKREDIATFELPKSGNPKWVKGVKKEDQF